MSKEEIGAAFDEILKIKWASGYGPVANKRETYGVSWEVLGQGPYQGVRRSCWGGFYTGPLPVLIPSMLSPDWPEEAARWLDFLFDPELSPFRNTILPFLPEENREMVSKVGIVLPNTDKMPQNVLFCFLYHLRNQREFRSMSKMWADLVDAGVHPAIAAIFGVPISYVNARENIIEYGVCDGGSGHNHMEPTLSLTEAFIKNYVAGTPGIIRETDRAPGTGCFHSKEFLRQTEYGSGYVVPTPYLGLKPPSELSHMVDFCKEIEEKYLG